VRLVSGADFWTTTPIERIGLRAIVLSDGLSGVRGAEWDERDPSINLPSATALAASWDPDLARRYAAVAADEARRKGVDVVLGPTINLHRSPLGGRHFEAFSEDPELTAELAVAYVRGLQGNGVAATPKHYVANDSETYRFTVDVQVDERTLRELYLLPFERAVEAGAWVLMSAYNSVNGVTMTRKRSPREPAELRVGLRRRRRQRLDGRAQPRRRVGGPGPGHARLGTRVERRLARGRARRPRRRGRSRPQSAATARLG
jgi:beta-glucosidase-like glycosyl hydrolase